MGSERSASGAGCAAVLVLDDGFELRIDATAPLTVRDAGVSSPRGSGEDTWG
ncbi:hypothetical protein ABZY93_32560 [Streptomyces smyrnaeus]|uniref:hypothetical protein n=1 Tax=Streptomyces smyrnaeus TaxID=1387713 RepID=UPI0033A906DD